MAKTPKSTTAARKLPVALAKKAEQKVASKQHRLMAEAAADIGLIKRRRTRIAEDFYDIGEALVRLKRPAVLDALNCPHFGDLCARVLKLPRTTADVLVQLVTRLTRADAAKFGQERSAALISLANATPADDTPHDVYVSTLRLPSGEKLKVATASVNDLKAAAAEYRKATADEGAGGRGRTTTPSEREEAATAQAALRARGLTTAKVTAVATRPGAPSNARIEGVPIAQLADLGRALTAPAPKKPAAAAKKKSPAATKPAATKKAPARGR